MSSCFHLTSCLANYKVEFRCGEKTIPTTANPKYLGVTFDRSLTYSKHLSQFSKKVNARCNLLRRLAGTTWGAHIDVLQKYLIALAFSPVWCPSDHTHRLDAALNNSLRLVSGCIRSTPRVMLPVVTGITPTDIRRNKQCLSLTRLAEADDQHTLHTMATTTAPGRKRLRSRHPFSEHARCIISDAAGKSRTTWTNEAWMRRWDAD